MADSGFAGRGFGEAEDEVAGRDDERRNEDLLASSLGAQREQLEQAARGAAALHGDEDARQVGRLGKLGGIEQPVGGRVQQISLPAETDHAGSLSHEARARQRHGRAGLSLALHSAALRD